ncbi:MAG: hypothetical protein M1522_00720 [Actinobacteria bacterium]|nr:hypothetical protein [Actinomycetota bacterium]
MMMEPNTAATGGDDSPERRAQRSEVAASTHDPSQIDQTGLTCVQCGADVWIDQDGTAYHWGGGMTGVDHDLDADHVAVPDTDDDDLLAFLTRTKAARNGDAGTGELDNTGRAASGAEALSAFAKRTGETGEDGETVLSDLICDLGHWADRNGVSFGEALRRGLRHYAFEVVAEAHPDADGWVDYACDPRGDAAPASIGRSFDASGLLDHLAELHEEMAGVCR